MKYTIAFADFGVSDTIKIYSSCSGDEIIQILMDITHLRDLYNGMDVDEACELIEYEFESGGLEGLSLTIVDSSDNEICAL